MDYVLARYSTYYLSTYVRVLSLLLALSWFMVDDAFNVIIATIPYLISYIRRIKQSGRSATRHERFLPPVIRLLICSCFFVSLTTAIDTHVFH